MKSEQELQQCFKIFIDKDNIINFIILELQPKLDDQVLFAKLVEEAIFRILNENIKKKYKLFVDIVAEKKGRRFATKARKTAIRIVSSEQLDRVVVVGSNVVSKVIVNFIIRAAGRGGNMKWFTGKEKEKAFKWLKN